MLFTVSSTVFLALLNRLRGWDWGKPYTSKYLCAVYAALFLAGFFLLDGSTLLNAATLFLVICAGYSLWAGPGWGAYFAAFHGRDMRHEEEIK